MEMEEGATATAPLEDALSTTVAVVLRESDDDDISDNDDDAVTTMGSPIPSAQTLPSSPLLQPTPRHAWIPRPAKRVAVPTQPRLIDELFAAVATVSSVIEDSDAEDDKSDSPSAIDARSTEVLLSPASQLHVLSQISEIAAARERQAAAAAKSTTQAHLPRPQHAWAPIAQRTQQKAPYLTRDKSGAKRKSPVSKPAASKKQRLTNSTVSAGFLADVATWDAFDEPVFEGSDVDEDAWSFEELSDSDF